MHTPQEKLDMLAAMVRQHELYWSELAQRAPTDLMRTFLASRWDPFYRQWVSQLPHAQYVGKYNPDAQADFVRHAARELSHLRELAAYNYIPTPDIGTAQHGAPSVAGELTISHGADGDVVIKHYHDGSSSSPSAHVGAPFHGGGHGGGWHGGHGGWRGGTRRFDMGGAGWWGWGWPYYGYPTGDCYYDAYGQLVCPQLTYAPVDTSVSGWFDSLKDAVLTVTGAKLTNQFIHDNGLEGVVKVAATAVGTVYGGPAGGAAAAALAGPVMSLGVDAKKPQAAQAPAKVAAAIQQHGPQAVAIAKQAIDKVSAAYHAKGIADAAAQGDPTAQAQMQNLADSAQAGSAGAQDVLGILSKLASSYEAGAGGGGGDAGGFDWGKLAANMMSAYGSGATISGAAPADLPAQARAAAAQMPGRVIGVVLRSDGQWSLEQFTSSDDADDWYGRWLGMPDAYVYAAYFDKADTTWPGPLNEQLSPRHAHRAVSSGWLAPALAFGGGFAAGKWGGQGYRWLRGKLDHHAA